MPRIVPTTGYGWVAYDLRDLAKDLDNLALLTSENISEVEAALCHFYLGQVLRSLILATRISRSEWTTARSLLTPLLQTSHFARPALHHKEVPEADRARDRRERWGTRPQPSSPRMTSASVSAIEASRQLYTFFWSGQYKIDLQSIRHLEDNLTVTVLEP